MPAMRSGDLERLGGNVSPWFLVLGSWSLVIGLLASLSAVAPWFEEWLAIAASFGQSNYSVRSVLWLQRRSNILGPWKHSNKYGLRHSMPRPLAETARTP